ncbi:MAG: hypothetical protein D3923_01695, partial [Candidatus Electrothrix sp. AR3]|nr:hypothetical protein [Candidatus Electrothrix sp. AR3]
MRQEYFNFIELKLSFLAYRLDMRGGLNILDLHIHAESFYQHFFNLLFDWKLKNLNAIQHNAAGIDLLDTANNICVQVSATASKQKIESALTKKLSAYKGYSFKFISISKDAAHLRGKTFCNPHSLSFDPSKDIYDIKTLLQYITTLDVDRQKKIHDFLQKELKNPVDPDKVESNLTTIIKILSKENLTPALSSDFETIPYEIEAKIAYNQLDTAISLIDEFKIHYHRIDKIYSDFDQQKP